MKICILTSKFPPIIGGGETYTFQLAKSLYEMGHEILVIANRNVRRKKESFLFQVIEIDGFDEENPNIKTALPQLYNALANKDIDVVHIHNYIPLYLFASLGKEFIKSKVVFSLHNTPHFPVRVFGFFNNFEAECSFVKNILNQRRHDIMLVASSYYTDSIKKISTVRQNIKIIPFGADTKIFNAEDNSRIDLPKSKNDIIIICPSRIIERKGILDAVKALSFLPKRYKLFLPTANRPVSADFLNLVIGKAKELKVYDRLILSNIEYQSWQMPDVYRACDIFLMPSHYEGFGIALIEAMAVGLPIVTTDVPGINEVVKHKYNGLMTQPKDAEKIAQSILEISSSPRLRNQLVENGLYSVKAKFNLSSHINEVIKLYEGLL